MTFGTALPVEHTYPHLLRRGVADALGKNTVVWNLGMPGESNDYISRTLIAAAPVLRPDLVVAMFTNASRREFVTHDGTYMHIIPNVSAGGITRIHKEILRHHEGLTSPLMDLINFYKNFKLVEMTLRLEKIPFLYTATDPVCLDDLSYAIDRSSDIGAYIERTDLARDGAHPGPEGNQNFIDVLLPIVLERLV